MRGVTRSWPGSVEELIEEQHALAEAVPPRWRPPRREYAVGGCFVCFERGKVGAGAAGDRGWAGAALIGAVGATAVIAGEAGAPYEPGVLALREGPLLEAATRRLPRLPDVLLVDATGRDHPRRAGLALHLGAVLDVPTVGVTHRPLIAEGDWPPDERGAFSPLFLDGALVGYWVRTRRGTRPLVVHEGWRVDPETAVEVVLAATGQLRAPEPLRVARQVAREARARENRRRRKEETMAKNLTVELEDRPGSLAAAAQALGSAGINIAGTVGYPTEGKGMLHVLVEDAAAARRALEGAGLRVREERDVIVTDIEDRPGALGEIATRVADAGVNLNLLYLATNTRVVIGADDLDKARSALE
jgi:deoxyribonuclease V